MWHGLKLPDAISIGQQLEEGTLVLLVSIVATEPNKVENRMMFLQVA